MGDAILGCFRGGLRHALTGSITLLISLALPSATHGVTKPRFVQKRFLEVTSGSSVSVIFRRPNTAGNLIVAYVVWDNGGAVSLTDSRGNSYVSAVGPSAASSGTAHAQIFYAANVGGGTNTVTAHFTTAISARGILYVHEYSGIDPLSPLGATVAASGSSTAMDSGFLGVTTANALLFAGAESDGQSITHRARGYRVRARKYGNMTADKNAPTPGSYNVTAMQKGTAWIMQLAVFNAAGSTPGNTAYPLKVSPNGRYLVDQNGTPFLMTGDSPQALIVNLSEAEADAFFADRQAAGFNLVWVNLLCAAYTGGRSDASTYDGIVPFTTSDDLSTPNESYFTRVDHMLNLAAQHGIVVLLDPAETGSFLSVLNANGVTKARNYGRYLGARYRNFDNIIWLSGNDFQSWSNPGDDAVVQAVAGGIQDNDDRHIHTVELDYLVSGSLDDSSWAPLIQLNASYTYYPTYAQVLTDYNRPNAIPTFLVEANYEYEHNAADLGTPNILRRQAYWSLLSGAAGQLYGNRYTWPFISAWQTHLDTPGSAQMTYVKFLFQPRQWYNLIPDQTHAVVTAGYGTFADSGALGDNDYLTAARTPDGTLVMAYMPTVRTITVDMSRLAAPANASWYDPTNGAFASVSGSPLANAGTRDFTPPGTNGDGDGDWVLVLEAASVPADTQAPTVPTGLSAAMVTSSQVALSWTASTDNVAVAGYQIYRDGALIRTTPATTYTDTGLAALTSYSYTVAAFDYANNASAQSAPLQVTTAPPGPEFMQQNYATPQTPQSSVAVIYTDAQTAGDTNILAIGWNDTTAAITSVTDSAGNLYQQAVGTFRGNGMSQAIYYAANIAAVAPGSNQVTVTFDQNAVYVDLRILEYSALRPTNPFQAGVSATGNSSSASTGSLSTTAPSELLFAAGMTGVLFTAPGPGFTSRVITTPDGDIVEDTVAASAGSYSAAASLSGGTWILQMAAFVPAGAP
jgi:chitodextrinase